MPRLDGKRGSKSLRLSLYGGRSMDGDELSHLPLSQRVRRISFSHIVLTRFLKGHLASRYCMYLKLFRYGYHYGNVDPCESNLLSLPRSRASCFLSINFLVLVRERLLRRSFSISDIVFRSSSVDSSLFPLGVVFACDCSFSFCALCAVDSLLLHMIGNPSTEAMPTCFLIFVGPGLFAAFFCTLTGTNTSGCAEDSVAGFGSLLRRYFFKLSVPLDKTPLRILLSMLPSTFKF
mmetsp:Transcript_3464/g.4641  ORF Transcript_3464/g.4641 Transcript_3464/m.4641 type:complete len:234 (+) Transcript_3464:961-1662(+)